MASIIISFSFPVLSQEITPPENNGAEDSTLEWKIKGGVRGSYARGISDPSYTIKPYLEGGFAGEWFETLAGFTWYQHYQVSDGAGHYGYINIAQPGIRLSFNPAEFLELSGGYRYLAGSLDYRAHDYSAGIDLDFETVSIGASYTGKMEDYTFNDVSMSNNSSMVSAEIAHYFSDTFSVDAVFDFSSIRYETLDTTYSKAGVRLGIFTNPWKPLTITAGIGYARDSSDYNLYGADAALMVKFLEHYSVSAMYMLTYYQAPQEETTKGGGGGPGAGSGGNPLLEPSLIGKSFAAHSLSFGVQFSY